MERSIQAATTLGMEVHEARRVLRDAPELVLGEAEPDERGLPPHAFRTTMPVVLGSGATIEHVVVVAIGRVPGDELPLVVRLALHPVDHAPVLPSFDGELVIDRQDEHGPTTLTLRGAYTVPLGPIGSVGDVPVGHRIVASSMEAFVERLAETLDDVGCPTQRRVAPKQALTPRSRSGR